MTTRSTRLTIIGATGETGRQALASALADSRVSEVRTYGRTAPAVPANDKLRHESLDFEALLKEGSTGGPETTKLRQGDADTVLIALGTTRALAGSAERFERIDREYVLAAARAARCEGKPQRLIYVSSGGANASSWFLYPRSKGLTEQGLVGLGYARTIIFRPGLLLVPGGRSEKRLTEQMAVAVIPRLPLVASSLSISTATLGRALVQAAVSSTSIGHDTTLAGHPASLIDNNVAQALGREFA